MNIRCYVEAKLLYVETKLEDHFPYTLVLMLLWVVFAWPLYLFAFVQEWLCERGSE